MSGAPIAQPTARELVIVSGRSGSGKSTALHVLEDTGFYCIDNLPAGLLPGMFAPSGDEAPPPRMAVSIDARNMPSSLARFGAILDSLPRDLPVEVLYLDADDNTLIKRFSETRRRHPLSDPGTSLAEALEAERRLLEPIAARAARTIDTSAMTLHELRDIVRRSVGAQPGSGMAVLFESFGFKRGLPVDADFVFDLRCLPNPHWDPRLRELSGLDAPVAEFLAASPEAGAMLEDITALLERWLERFADSNRSYTTVALGCTGGRHRSVYMAEQLCARFRGRFPGAQIRHRDLAREGSP
jgi:UPF0042 nucleotide-binding protein